MAPSVAIIGTRGYPSYYGGFETAVRALAPYLVNAGWEVCVYGRRGATTESAEDKDPRVLTRTTTGFETKSLSTLSYGFTSSLDAAVRKPDVALVMNVANGFWLPILRARGVPTLVNVDGIEWERAKWGGVAKSMFKTGAWITSKVGNTLVSDSREIARRWERDFGVKSEFIPYGGAFPRPLPVEVGLEHRKYVLVVSRLVPENTIPEFLIAASRLSIHLPVVIVGSSGYGGALDEAARRLSEENSNVRWLGHVSDDARLLSLWQHAGVYFHGHSVGGTNPALVQAMACGAPTVARDTVYNREVLGESGVFVAPEPNEIYQAVLEIAKAPTTADLMASAAIERASGEYSWERVCGAYLDALTRLRER